MPGPNTLLQDPADLPKITGKPTGQGYGAARKGPDVHGPIEDAVVNETYPQGQSFKTELKEVPNIGVK
jgi:hypothetical protein|tara:strand:- start:951 stop:1154 length:204 start_codon:yes stop_codon:yes gene_type:complete